MDVKYGRVYTHSDVQEIVEAALGLTFGTGGEATSRLVLGTATTIPADEPTFLMRGKDKATCAAISHYFDVARTVGASDEHLRSVTHSAAEFASWQARNHDLVKIPD